MENKVYIVVGHVKCEGESLEQSGKVFYDHQKALKYGTWLVNQGYCAYSVKEVEVE